MLIPIIKDFNNTFSYLISNSVEKTKDVFDPVSKGLLNLSQGESGKYDGINDILKIGWTSIQICFWFLVQTIQYIVSFQWLRDFSYLPISIPNHMLSSNENNFFPAARPLQNFNNSIVSLVGDRHNILQRFFFSNQTIAKPETGLAISDQNLPYNNFILGLPNVTHHGAPINSWSLSFLSNKWFDPLTVPVNFLSTGLESSSKNISQLSSLPEQITGDLRISNIILMSILLCIATGFSSFFNSFFISFPLSLSNLLSLRYLIIQKFWAGCISVLGIVFGEITFMLFLILPPPFIQITLVYLESVWPYIIGLSLIIFIIFDLISNPYTNTVSLYQNVGLETSSKLPDNQKLSGTNNRVFGDRNLTRFLPIKLGNQALKIFGFSFLLALTEQSCYFSFFGSLNLSSTGNFLDTYLFAASKSPIILFFSCVGFLIGSFLAIIIYNLVIAKAIFLIASLTIKIKRVAQRQYNPDFIRNWFSNRQTYFFSRNSSTNEKNNWVLVIQIYTSIKNSIMSRLRYLFFSIKSKDFFKSLLFGLKNIIQRFIIYLPGGKRMVSFLFPGQAYSYKSDFSTKFLKPNKKGSLNGNKTKGQLSSTQDYQSFSSGFKIEPKNAFLSLENKVENMLRSNSFNMSNSALPNKSEKTSSQNSSLSLGDPVKGASRGPTTNNQISGNASQLISKAFYNKIDKVLLTCLITLSFTTIPYYSFDYLLNNFFGFIPQEQILNANSLRVNFPDYTNLLGITLSDNNSVINTDVSLYDRAHFMYGEWPNSFESLNYQGELMWTNLQDHRRQKRTRRSTQLKFKTLKTKISTSWKEFKLSSGFSGSTRPYSFDSETNLSKDLRINSEINNKEGSENSKLKPLSKTLTDNSLQDSSGLLLDSQMDNQNNRIEKNRNQVQKSLRNTNNLSNLFYKIFLAESKGLKSLDSRFWFSDLPKSESASPFKPLNENPSEFSKNLKTLEDTNNESYSWKNYYNQSSKTKEYMPKVPEEIRPSISLSETIKPLSTSTFIDLSGGEKYLKTYPKNWKRIITEKYYQNPIYQAVLSNDLKNFLKREPLTQQLTNNQENELYFLRVKMAHYYDSLRFYFSLKESINNTRVKTDEADSGFGAFKNQNRESIDSRETSFTGSQKDFNVLDEKKDFEKIWTNKRKPNFKKPSYVDKTKPESIINLSGLKNQTKDASLFSQRENTDARVEESLKSPPFQFKSMTSMNYRQQFKGTLKTVKQLFAISLPESVSSFSNTEFEQNMVSSPSSTKDLGKSSEITSKEPTQSRKVFSQAIEGTEPIEKSYKYDKYLFNEYSYPKNEFLHEEGRGLNSRKSTISPLRESSSQNSISSSTDKKVNMSLNSASVFGGPPNQLIDSGANQNQFLNTDSSPFLKNKNIEADSDFGRSENQNRKSKGSGNPVKGASRGPTDLASGSRGYRGISLATKNIYNLFGSNDPFYVGWDQNLRKFVLTSRILSRSSALNYNATSSKFDLNQNKKQKPLDFNNENSTLPYSDISDLRNQIKNRNNKELSTASNVPVYSIKDLKRLEENKRNFNQQSLHLYRSYTSWPFFKHQLKNSPSRPYFVLYENYVNILNKQIHLFRNININDIDTKSLTFLYSYSFNNNVKKYVSQLPINIYKQSMRPSSLENLFTPTSNARSSFLWPGSVMPAWEYYFW